LADFREAVTEAIGREPTNALIASAVWSDDLEWLDQSQGWFWRPIEPDSNRNRLVNKIRQVLAVADSIDLPELRTAARRHHRMGGFAPPTKILGEICRRLSFAEVKDGRIFSLLTPEQKEETLRGFNGDIAAILKRDGPLLSRLDLLERALAAGLNENTYNIYAGYSPILWRPAPGFYALVGAELPPGTVEAQQEISHERAATLISDRWLHGGGCQLAWLLGRGGALDGLVNVPSAYARFLQGDWELLDSAGQPLGRAQVGDHRMAVKAHLASFRCGSRRCSNPQLSSCWTQLRTAIGRKRASR
jgi:hypothetical protein